MRIRLTKDLSPLRGKVKGAEFDWPRATITAMSRQLKDRDWYVALGPNGEDPREPAGDLICKEHALANQT